MKYDIRAVLEGMGYKIPDADVYSNIAIWRDWYKGYRAQFHDYAQYNGRKKIKRRRKTLRMAKKVCEDHANLLLNEKVQIAVGDESIQKLIDQAFEDNKFRVRANKLVEIAFALGTGAFVEHDNGEGGVDIDYIRADMIFPTRWEGETIIDCAFASIRTIQGLKYFYINLHQLENQEYVIYNKLVPIDDAGNAKMIMIGSDGKKGKPVPEEVKPDPETQLLYDDLQPEVRTGSITPRFQFIGPNQVNNIDMESPLGISVYANSIDNLEGIDLIYDSYCGEFRLGKKRIVVPLSMLQVVQEDDQTWMAFDDNDTEFYGLKDDNLTEIKEINMELRVDDHDKALQRNFNILSFKTGLGNDRYKFEQGSVKTATEVISEKSELFQNLKKNELVLESAIKDMCKAIAEIHGVRKAFDVEINFDDSIIEDTEAKRARMQAMATSGLFPLWRYYHEYEGYSKEEAKEIAEEAQGAEMPGLGFEDDEGGEIGKGAGSSGGGAGGAE